jgi:hypothetical protein
MRTRNFIVAVVLAALALVRCASVEPSGGPAAGHGRIVGVCYRVDGNAMPVINGRPNLTYTPLQGIDLELMVAGTMTRQRIVTTHAGGHFEFDWEPGEYYLLRTDSGGSVTSDSSSRSRDFSIRSGETTELRVEFRGQVAD